MNNGDDDLSAALRRLQGAEETLVRELTDVCEIPAPTFDEARRAGHVAERMKAIGLADVTVDEIGNVTGLGRGAPGARVMVAAHIDTVFPAGTDVRVRRENGRLCAPGAGDNAASVGCMLHVASLLKDMDVPGEILFASPVGEEGNGDLRGMRALIARHGRRLDAVIAVDGKLGGVVVRAVGSVRYRIRVRGPGGHSWGDFGRPSAIHILSEIVARLSRLDVPTEPRTTFNVGTIRGGTSVNSVAADAVAELDLRSIDPAALKRLDRQARAAVAAVPIPEGVEVHVENIGARPPGRTSEMSWLVRAARRALHAVGVEPLLSSSSTDANIPMAEGIPAICFGVYRGGGAHTLAEHVEVRSLTLGARALLLLLVDTLREAPASKTAPPPKPRAPSG